MIAIGNALGLEGGPTVTVGVVGTLGRSIEGSSGEVLEDLIQTDAPINPGNSGGPLVNLQGEVVGINTAVAGPTSGGFQPVGIGFAVAINRAKPIADDLVAHGRVIRPWLGVSIASVTPAVASQLGLSVREGALVFNVERLGPADKAGLQQRDVIVRLGDQAVADARTLRKAVESFSIGGRVQVTVVRDGRQISFDVTLEGMPASVEG